ncbi:MAG TPA: hypothetical protein DD730_06765, partial [Desulfosporosinus sp.]|nr:hypothetical protein [Desulfosporosinus sp.]
ILLLPGLYHFIKELSVGNLEIISILIGSALMIEGLTKLWLGEIEIKERQFKKYEKIHKSGKFKHILLQTLYFVIMCCAIISISNIRRYEFIFEGLNIFNFIGITIFACFCGLLIGMSSWENSEKRYKKYIDKNKD